MKASRRRRRRGQAVIEFAMVSVLFVAMLALTYNAILAFSIQQYISYATFMAARAFQASAATGDAQQQNAIDTFRSFFPDMQNVDKTMNYDLVFPAFARRKVLAKITSVTLPVPNPTQVGVQAESTFAVSFRVPFAQIPLGDAFKEFTWLELEAKSSLGREVSAEECRSYFERRYKSILDSLRSAGAPLGGSSEVQQMHQNMEDNGC